MENNNKLQQCYHIYSISDSQVNTMECYFIATRVKSATASKQLNVHCVKNAGQFQN